MENSGFNLVYSQGVIDFVSVANEYCSFLEQGNLGDRKETVGKLQSLLPLLYLRGALLPDVESMFEDVNEKFVTEEDWNRINGILRSKLGEFDDFLEVFDPRMKESDLPVVCSISENLADIYQDIKNFLMLYRVGTNEIMNDSIWECKNNFRDYWGQKAVNSLRAIHLLACNDNLDEENDNGYQGDDFNLDTGSWIISQRQKDFQDNE